MAHVLVVDDEPDHRELLRRLLASMGHSCDAASSGEEGLQRLLEREYDAVLTDIRMTGMDGLTFLREARTIVEARTPCILVTAYGDEQTYLKALRLGACNLVPKPFQPEDLGAALDDALELRRLYRMRREYREELERRLREREREVRQNYDGILGALAALLEPESHTTSQDCMRIKDYAAVLGEAMGLDRAEVRDLEFGALLHDVGMHLVPSSILDKDGPLTEAEWDAVRAHPMRGVDMVARVPLLAGATPVIRHHHEHFDGSGYPEGRAGEDIPLLARIFAVVDAYDAIVEGRRHRAARSVEEALAEIRSGAGRQFDPAVVDALERALPGLSEVRERHAAGETAAGEAASGADD